MHTFLSREKYVPAAQAYEIVFAVLQKCYFCAMSKIKLVSWNVNGIRASVKKDFMGNFKKLAPDVLGLQETKAQDDQVLEALKDLKGYHIYTCSAVKKGYSGTAIISKEEALSVQYGMDNEEHDQEGRIVTAEYKDFYVSNVYVPNSKNDLSRLDYRQKWDADYLSFLKKLEKKKPVITCGDFNVAHKDIDLARPKANYNKSAGFTQKEIDGMDNFTGAGLIDTFRFKNGAVTEKYTWWSYRAGARERNVGWRIDYFLVSESLSKNIEAAAIHPEILGSDHCPVSVTLKF